MLAMELQRRGWYLRADCIWNKSQPFPESVLSRPRKAHEYVFMFSKSSSSKYFFDSTAVRMNDKHITTNWAGPSSKTTQITPCANAGTYREACDLSWNPQWGFVSCLWETIRKDGATMVSFGESCSEVEKVMQM